jgi:hypothetical protein
MREELPGELAPGGRAAAAARPQLHASCAMP